MLHRVVAAVVGLLIIYSLLRGYRLGRQGLFSGGMVLMVLSYMGIVVLLTQVFIGAVAIWSNFPVAIRAYHIGLATALWGIMVTVALVCRMREPGNQVALQSAYVGPDPGTTATSQESD